jgi:Rrf2 family protein
MLPKTAEYALRAVVWLARTPGQIEPADVLAEKTKVPRRYLHKVLQDLVHAKLIHSQPGPGGGYSLAHPPHRLSILDVVNAVSPIERIERCPLRLRTHVELCPLHKELDKAYATVQTALSKVTIAQLVRPTCPIMPLCEVKK